MQIFGLAVMFSGKVDDAFDPRLDLAQQFRLTLYALPVTLKIFGRFFNLNESALDGCHQCNNGWVLYLHQRADGPPQLIRHALFSLPQLSDLVTKNMLGLIGVAQLLMLFGQCHIFTVDDC